MMLGEMLAAARDSGADLEDWLGRSDPALREELAAAAEREGVSPAGYVRQAVADFSARASGDDWASLTSRMHDAPNPGRACLVVMLRWRLRQSAGAQPCGEGRP